MAAKSSISFDNLDKALTSLGGALTPLPSNDRERDGAIQRFEYSFEILWKIAKKVLAYYGLDSGSPREIFRSMAQLGWIGTAKEWIVFLEARNATAHTYNEKTAVEVFNHACVFHTKALGLTAVLKKKVQDAAD